MVEGLVLIAALSIGQAGGAAPAAEPHEVLGLLSPSAEVGEKEAPPTPEPPADRTLFMRAVQGTWPGYFMDSSRIQINGWLTPSYNASSAAQNNFPVVWNDRANEFLFQQVWVRFERTILTTGTNEMSVGFRSDWLYGSDYRFTLPRGLWNSQLENADGAQNLYGVDPIQFYVNAYFPTVFNGTEVRVGRHYCPFGYESLEAISTPFMSRSYAFNYCPPFTHMGLMLLSNLTPQINVQAMLINGNDVFFDKSEEMRYAGKFTWTSADARDIVSLGTSVGRGKFNAGDPFTAATVALANEPAGRNNINVFDLTYTHVFNSNWTYGLEVIYGYQYGVPANVPGGIISTDVTSGTAHWGSVVNYLFYNINAQWTTLARLEFFDDFEGQRTGFEGLYSAITWGVQYRPNKAVALRPEIRYDYNGYSRPFEGNKHWLLTAGTDLIVRW